MADIDCGAVDHLAHRVQDPSGDVERESIVPAVIAVSLSAPSQLFPREAAMVRLANLAAPTLPTDPAAPPTLEPGQTPPSASGVCPSGECADLAPLHPGYLLPPRPPERRADKIVGNEWDSAASTPGTSVRLWRHYQRSRVPSAHLPREFKLS